MRVSGEVGPSGPSLSLGAAGKTSEAGTGSVGAGVLVHLEMLV